MPEKLTKFDRCKRALIREGYAEDELKVTFKTEQELVDFFNESRKVRKQEIKVPNEDGEEEPEDSFRLPESEVATLERQKKQEDDSKKQEEHEIPRAAFDAQAPKTIADGGIAPTYDEFLKSLDEGMSGDNSNVPNN